MRCVIRVECERRIGAEATTQTQYHISSVETQQSEERARICRRHWSIENGLHWSLDVSFGEDNSRVRMGNGAEKLSRLRRMALNLLKLETSRKTASRTNASAPAGTTTTSSRCLELETRLP
ncbi:MAG: ISAs1 family transposase [Phycisphaerales bacterium]|nr:MAG: ISAs1 family transposase [Phycisphaerales bacterium]